MAWLQISLNASEGKVETYSECFMQLGAVSVTLEDAENNPLFEPPPGTTPLWHKTRVVGLFDSTINLPTIKKFLKNHLGADALQTLEINTLEEKNWTRAWMDQFHPMRFGEKLWICPTFSEIPDPSAVNIILDPGMAFGTGTHPTTSLCLEWLDKHPPHNAVVIDYGCGSGILGIAALKLGASFVYAVDHDSQALESTKANAKQNGFAETHLLPLFPKQLPLELLKLPKKADLILSNILANPLIELAPTFAHVVREGGMIVLSGILDNQTNGILEHYQPGFKILDISKKEEWVRISAIKLTEKR